MGIAARLVELSHVFKPVREGGIQPLRSEPAVMETLSCTQSLRGLHLTLSRQRPPAVVPSTRQKGQAFDSTKKLTKKPHQAQIHDAERATQPIKEEPTDHEYSPHKVFCSLTDMSKKLRVECQLTRNDFLLQCPTQAPTLRIVSARQT